MGRIKCTLIKKTARQLLEGVNNFTSEFNRNKKVLRDTMPSKKMRNKIAGYISHLKRVE